MGKLLACAMTLMFLATTFLVAQGNEDTEPDRGMRLYTRNCETCHGTLGDGGGPSAAFLSCRPADFTNPEFWQGDVETKITNTILKGKGEMPSFNLESHEIRAVIDYIKRYIRHPEKTGDKGQG